MSRVIVIGGGASGLVSAIMAAKSGNDVTVLERNNICGKKILLTGNGKCNYWNVDQNISHYHSENKEILESIITEEIKEEILDFFDNIGIVPKKKNGYYYPYSNQATSMQNALINEIKYSKVKVVNDVYVEDVIKKKDEFIVKTDKEQYRTDRVIVAMGSMAYPKTGTDGNGYNLLQRLGHDLIKPLPALVQLKGQASYFKNWAGVREDVAVKLYENDKFIKEEHGEIQLTDYGVSGICVMQLSRFVNRGLNLKRCEKLIINFLPWLKNAEDFINWMNERNKKLSNRNITELLDGVLNYKLVNLFIKLVDISATNKWDELNDEIKYDLANKIVAFDFLVTASNDFSRAQVCSGGISLKDIDVLTMESKKINGLYIVGEILDVDGDCGGYNLGFAFMSGYLAGRSIK